MTTICPRRLIAGGKEPAEPHLELGAQPHELVGAHGALPVEDAPQALPVDAHTPGELGDGDAAAPA